jgi:hypothetical protein
LKTLTEKDGSVAEGLKGVLFVGREVGEYYFKGRAVRESGEVRRDEDFLP